MSIPGNLPIGLKLKIMQYVGHPTSHLINVLITRKVKYGIDTHSFQTWYFENEV